MLSLFGTELLVSEVSQERMSCWKIFKASSLDDATCKYFYDAYIFALYLIIENCSCVGSSCLAVEVLSVFSVFQNPLEFFVMLSIYPDPVSTGRLWHVVFVPFFF